MVPSNWLLLQIEGGEFIIAQEYQTIGKAKAIDRLRVR
jgi:hypothetical protein